MGAPGALGYALLALGPGAAFWAIFIAPKSFVSLLAVFSTFFWLSAMLATATALRLAGAPAHLLRALPFFALGGGGDDIPPSSASSSAAAACVPVLVAAVLAEELARALVAAPLHERAVRELEALAAARGEALSALDRVSLSFAWGFGHAACHALFLYAYALPLAAGPGTYYAPQCPQMPAFATGAMAALGGGAALAAAAVVGLEAWRGGGGEAGGSSSPPPSLSFPQNEGRALAAPSSGAGPGDAAAAGGGGGGRGAAAAAAAASRGQRLARRLRVCPRASCSLLAAFLRSRRAWLSAPGWPLRVLFPPALHLLVALATLAALHPGGGCAGSSAAVLALGLGAGAVAARRAVALVAAEDGGRWATVEGEENEGPAGERAARTPSPQALQPMGGGGGVRYRSSGGGSGGGGGELRRER